MQQAIRITLYRSGATLRPRIVPARALPVAALCLGKPVDEALTLLPRIFNLCGAAQEAALRLSLDQTPLPREALRREILREHLMKFCISWPTLLGMAPCPMPSGWDKPAGLTSGQLFGASAMLPAPSTLNDWLETGGGFAPVLAAIRTRFCKGEAAADLPVVTPATVMADAACDNSVAARHAAHPMMRHIAQTHGKGPFWHAFGRLLDLDAARVGAMPAPARQPDGAGTAPAARGLYAIRATQSGGMITGLTRRTPTDHLVAPGGVMEQSLASLPAHKASLAALVVDILDPCQPVTLEEAQNA